MNKSLGRRRVLGLVEPYKQVKLGLMFLLLNTVFSFLIAGVFIYYIWDVFATIRDHFAMLGQSTAFSFNKFSVPLTVTGILLFVFIALTLYLSIRYTYQIYGPLVSIHRYLDSLLTGQKPKDLFLRESDQLKDLARKLNEVGNVFARIENKHQATTGPLIAVRRFVDELLKGETPKALHLREDDELKDIATKLNELSENLGSLKQVRTGQLDGPQKAILRYLDECLEKRKPRPIKLRDGDSLSDIAEKLNRLVDLIKFED